MVHGDLSNIGTKVRKERRSKGLSQSELSKQGSSPSTKPSSSQSESIGQSSSPSNKPS